MKTRSAKGKEKTFSDLDEDTLYVVAEMLYRNGAKQDLASLCRVRKIAKKPGLKWLYRDIVLDFSGMEAPWTSLLLSVLMHITPGHRSYVQSLTVTMGSKLYSYSMTLARRYMVDVLSLLPLLPMVKFFCWDALEPLSDRLTRAIEAHPNIEELHITILDAGYGKFGYLPSFPYMSHNPRSVKLTVAYCNIGSARCFGFRGNIREYVDRYKPDGIMEIENCQTLPNLETLCLEYYTFRRRTLNMVQQQVRFSMLKSLELRACYHVNNLLQSISYAPEGIRLKTLKIVGVAEDYDDATSIHYRFQQQHCYSDFLESFEGLEELVLDDYGLDQDFVRSLASHGTTLRKLEIHEYGSTSRSTSRTRELLRFDGYSEPSLLSLLELRDSCPDLQVLHLDLPRAESNVKSPDVARLLRSFTNLIQLTITLICDDYVRHLLSFGVAPTTKLTKKQAERMSNLVWGPKLERCDLITCDSYGAQYEYWPEHSVNKWGRWTKHHEEYHRMHWRITHEGNKSRATDVLLRTDTPEEKYIKRLARSLEESYELPQPPGGRAARLKWKNDLSLRAESRRVTCDENLTTVWDRSSRFHPLDTNNHPAG